MLRGRSFVRMCVLFASDTCMCLPHLPSCDTAVACRQHACGEVADKYVEFEGVLIAIDMVLHKLSVYRHLLFNRLPYTERYIPVRA